MKILIAIATILILGIKVYAQNIIFSDEKLKSYLINEYCVDLDNDEIPDIDADFNDDNEIQISEAQSINNLIIGKYPDTYFISTIQDISSFENLNKLIIIHNDSLSNISSLSIDGLTYLWIGTCLSLKYIDISDLAEINHLRIEDIDSLDYLNLQNGNFPNDLFSLFYTENIKYACVDSISAEYIEVSYHMVEGAEPSINCSEVGIFENYVDKNKANIFPNPTTGIFTINGVDSRIIEIRIIDDIGRIVLINTPNTNKIDISDLNPGIYIITIESIDGNISHKKIFKKL